MAIVQMKNVSKKYQLGKQQVDALKSIDIDINQGEFISVAGPSGSGKTTMLNLIGCLDKPTAGQILIGDQDISKLSLKKLTLIRREKIGFIFQFFNLLPVLSVYENVEYPLLLKNHSKKERKNRVISLLEQVGLKDFHKRKPNELSGGQQQRVAIARALVTNPLIVLADEPTGNLDSSTALDIIKLMKDVNKEHNTTFLFSTHDPKILVYASKQVSLKDGEIVDVK
ncbi:MAG: ABC transporter ATP-binding protein [Candidatus Hodarchaeota archaeon]